jgi:hypothetical protein
MTRSCLRTAVVALGIMACASAAHAADPRFQQVALLAANDRVSLVFELTDEPQNVATRRVSAAVLELDAGPVVMPAKATSFMAPPGVRYVMGVSIQAGDGTTVGRLKARITLLERARSAVRVVGRRVYVDFSPDLLPAPAAPPERTIVSQPRPAVSSAAAAASVTPTVKPAEVPAPPAASQAAYRAAVQGAVERFQQLTPFLLSATTAPSESVLKAVGNTLTGIQGLLLSVDVPAESKSTHEALLSGIAAAVSAVSPTFTGDRVAQAKQAIGAVQSVVGSL